MPRFREQLNIQSAAEGKKKSKMVKRKTQPLIDSESSSGSDSDLDSELLSLAKKKKTTRLASNSPGGANSGSDSGSDSDDDSDAKPAAAPPQRKKRGAKAAASSSESEASASESGSGGSDESEAETEEPAAPTPASTAATGVKRKQQDEEDEEEEEEEDKSEPEEGQVSSGESGSGSGSDDESGSESSSDDSEFDDGYDDNLMGDEEDRARLNGLSEKERETEIFKRIERRDVMKTRWEIERKLKLAKKAERAKDKESQPPRKKKKKTKKVKQAQQQQQQQQQQKEQQEKKKAKAPSPEPEEASPPPQHRQEEEGEEASEGEVDNESVLSSSPDKSGKDAESASGASDFFDPKERSKERKKNVEANRTDDKRSNAMAMLKAKREGKAKREEEEAKREAQRKAEADDRDDLEDVRGGKSSQKLKASDIYSDDSGSDSDDGDKKAGPARSRSGSGSGSGSGSDSRSSSDSETEGQSSDAKEKKSSSGSSSSKKPVAISTRDELNKLRISRHKIERFIALPMFDTIVLNCFVRINIGNNNGRPVYRVAEIVGVVETAKIYQFGKGRTNKGFKLKHGSQERVFRLEFISNQDFTDSEYQKWISVCESTGTAMPCVDMIDKKAREIKEAIQYEFKDADIDKLIEEKNRFRAHPTNYAMKKTLLMKERDAAQLRGEDELARDLNTQIQELEERAGYLDKRRSSSISLISYINDRNRKRNVEDAEKAIMEEIRATRGIKIEDPFTRRQTQPRMSFKANEKRDEPETIQMAPPPPPGQKKKPEEKRASSSTDNLYSLHDFEIDLDVPLPISAVNVLPKPVEKPVKESGPKRSLNLEDYKKKRGLI